MRRAKRRRYGKDKKKQDSASKEDKTAVGRAIRLKHGQEQCFAKHKPLFSVETDPDSSSSSIYVRTFMLWSRQ